MPIYGAKTWKSMCKRKQISSKLRVYWGPLPVSRHNGKHQSTCWCGYWGPSLPPNAAVNIPLPDDVETGVHHQLPDTVGHIPPPADVDTGVYPPPPETVGNIPPSADIDTEVNPCLLALWLTSIQSLMWILESTLNYPALWESSPYPLMLILRSTPCHPAQRKTSLLLLMLILKSTPSTRDSGKYPSTCWCGYWLLRSTPVILRCGYWCPCPTTKRHGK